MDNLFDDSTHTHQQSGEHWISMSDLMAGLMMVFLTIAVAYMHFVKQEKNNVQQEKSKIEHIAKTYSNTKEHIYTSLGAEFSKDLSTWDAEIDKDTLEVRFKSPETLFALGKADLKPQFKDMLNDFFPRYLKVLDRYKDNITEIRIEGHTSSDWNGSNSTDEAYFNNMALSQGRTRAVLQYVYQIPSIADHRAWIKKIFSAVGFSSAHPIIGEDGKENKIRSRRVTFKVLTNAEDQIKIILDQ